jgi:hypothetical protein
VRKAAVVVVLALAFLAVPIGALCTSCCPRSDPAQKIGGAMPCCDGCAPKVASSKSSAPAVTVERVSLDRLSVALTTPHPGLRALDSSAWIDPFVSLSPPAGAGPPSSILRL